MSAAADAVPAIVIAIAAPSSFALTAVASAWAATLSVVVNYEKY